MGRRSTTDPNRRPKKGNSDRQRRQNEHRKRLIALGVPEQELVRMTAKDMRLLIRNPEKVKKAYASG
jgi:hypothetical protein